MKEIAVGMISLGCSKNRVDSELMLGELARAGYCFTADPAQADVIIVNTCGFIEKAKEESIHTILEMAQYKKSGRLKGLIVAGCLSQRYRQELPIELPEVDGFLGVTAYEKVVEAVEQVLRKSRYEQFDAPTAQGCYQNRVLTTPSHYAYVKIAEGCNNRCSYCAIPYIRGKLQSRAMEDIRAEVEALLARGVKEVILVAQDTTKYGQDLYGKPMLAELLDDLAQLRGLEWLRILYCYPENITEELLDTMLRHKCIVKYLDIPIQHIDDDVLKRMNRRASRDSIYRVVRMIREKSSDFVIRTTLIAGFPGETEREFETLKQGVLELEFDRLGVFAYSREEGTPAAGFDGQIEEEIKEVRVAELMSIQQRISMEANKRRLGTICRVLIEERLEDGSYAGRSPGEAPEIDGVVLVESEQPLKSGEFYDVKLTGADSYDLYGEIV